ncbi:MAG: chromosomal replication initiator DnaA [Pseudomonadota bacterium]
MSAGRDQLPLPIGGEAAAEDVLRAPSNAIALAELERWRAWPGGRLALIGPAASGKSTMAAAWAREVGAAALPAEALEGADLAALAETGAVVEDADRRLSPEGEVALFHLHERCAAAARPLLLTARTPPARWAVGLKDLATRLGAWPLARIEPPEDALLEALAARLLAARGLRAEPGLPRYLVRRLDRSHAALRDAVAALDAAALARRARVTIALAAEVLAEDAPR